MNKYFLRVIVFCLAAMHGLAFSAQDAVFVPVSPDDGKSVEPKSIHADGSPESRSGESISLESFIADSQLIKWDIAGAFVGTTVIGVTSWKWGNSSFRFHNEGWFTESTKFGGMDKLGHAFSTYALTNAFSERMVAEGVDSGRAPLDAVILGQVLTFYIEVFDGMSNQHGFAYEDAVMNALGGGLAYLRQTYPAIKDAVDYRMEYKPSGGYKGLDHYSDQKYLLAFKLGQGQTFLRYFELQTGYYSVGFYKDEVEKGVPKQRFGFVGIGLNLSELLLGTPKKTDGTGKTLGRFFFEHIQLPNTAIRDEQKI